MLKFHLLFIFCCLLQLFSPFFMAHANDIQGRWQQVDLLPSTTLNNGCAFVTVVTRSINIGNSSDTSFVGIYGNGEQRFWINSPNKNCHFPEDAPMQRQRLWKIDGVSSGNLRWHMKAKDGQCLGDGCNQKGVSVAPFDTVMLQKGESIIDEASDVGVEPIRFVKFESLRKRVDAAAREFGGLIGLLDAGECNAFVTESLTIDSELRKNQIGFCTIYRQLFATNPPIVRTSVGRRDSVDRVVFANGTVQEVDDVFIGGFAEYLDDTTTPRFVVMRKQSGKWKIRALFGF